MVNNWYIILRFVDPTNRISQGQTITAAALRVTAFNSRLTKELDIGIYGFKGGSIPNPTDTLLGVWDNNDTTKKYDTNNPNLPTNWTAGTEYTFTTSDDDSILEIIEEIIADAGFDGDFGLRFTEAVGAGSVAVEIYTIDSLNSNKGKYMELDITYDYVNEDIFDIQLISAPSSKKGDRYKAQLVLEINQSVT